MRPGYCHRAGTVLHLRICFALLAAFLCFAGVLPAAAQSPSPPVYNPANGHWYQVVRVPGRITWSAARAAAQSQSFAGLPGHLATITSPEENQFLVSSVVNGAPYGEQWWLGGYQDRTAPDYYEPSGGWRWVTGEPFSYSNWIEGEPNNNPVFNGGEEALELQQERGYRWNDLPDLLGLGGYLVEYEPPPPAVVFVQIVPQAVVGGTTVAGQVTLAAPAGAGGALLTLFSSNPAAAVVPATLAVPAGASAASFPIVTFPVAVPTAVVITVAGFGVAGTAALQVLPASLPLPTGNLLVNGSFEQPFVAYGLVNLTLRRIDELPGWRLLRGTVDVVPDAGWQQAPGQGRQSLDLVGTPGAATIEQSFATEPGRFYTFSGWMAHAWGIPEGRANVFLNGQFFVQLFHSNALYGRATAAEMRWQPFAYTFQATAPATTLSLADVTGIWDGGGGAVLDGLAVVPTSQPFPPFPPFPPGPPAVLAVRLISPTQIELSWTDTSADETGFEIQRRSGASDWMRIAVVAANTTRFSDFGVSPATTYTYRVRAENAAGGSAWSNEAVVTTLPTP
jgi:Protein of unknown function (DUF642)/Fibronectin type III domain/Lectin C-type domain